MKNVISTKSYFAEKAEKYDEVEDQVYWKLSDELLWFQMQKYLNSYRENFTFLDAGGGTGRWTVKILKAYPKAKGVLIDKSSKMLNVAKKKVQKENLETRIELLQGDLLKRNLVNNEDFDVVFNFHNVLGFVADPAIAMQNMYRYLRNGGSMISFVPNLFHLIYFNVTNGDVDEASLALKNKKGRFVKGMPRIHLFTPYSIKKLYEINKLKIIEINGFPVTLYPGFQETQISGTTKNIDTILGEQKSFDKIFSIEKKLLSDTSLASRGNNILIVGEK